MQDHVKKLKKLLGSNDKLVCMFAPSFVADFEYPEVVYRLRKLGFDQVVELTFGAKMTNLTYYSILKGDGDRTWITSPCPTLVNFVRNQYPELIPNLVPVHSPMGCMSLICKKLLPKHKQVFIGPCITKKMEAEEIGGIDCALTFRELDSLFKEYGIEDKIKESKYIRTFDKFYNDYTKIYPLSGGLSETLHHRHLFKKNEILVLDGIANIEKVFKKFKDGKYGKYKLLDILSCNGGCIGGPGMVGKYPLKERKKRVVKYKEYASRFERDLGRTGYKVHAEDIDFRREFK
jgi:iron only hydrogenase large subunit-like protein